MIDPKSLLREAYLERTKGGGEARMTDQGFRKFRRRRKGQSPSATGVEAVARPGQPAHSASDAASAPADAALSAFSPAPHAQQKVAASNPLRLFPETPGRKGEVFDPQVEDRSAPEAETAEPDMTPSFWQSEPAPTLPARLPDPWHLMRRVEVTGLSERRRRLPLVDFFRGSASSRSFDLLRTRLLQTLREQGWTRVAVCGPTQGCGASFIAANLAMSLARVPGTRTVLMDLNLRSPGIANALGLGRAALYNGDMQGFLRGELRVEEHLLGASDGLAIGLNNVPSYNPSEILHEPRCAEVLDDMIQRTRADVALFDLPPVLESDDVVAFLPQVDGVLLVSDGSQTTARHLKACEALLAGHTQLLGVVLNRARSDDSLAPAR